MMTAPHVVLHRDLKRRRRRRQASSCSMFVRRPIIVDVSKIVVSVLSGMAILYAVCGIIAFRHMVVDNNDDHQISSGGRSLRTMSNVNVRSDPNPIIKIPLVIRNVETQPIRDLQRVFPIRCGGRAVLDESKEGDTHDGGPQQWNDDDYEEIDHPGMAFSTGGRERLKLLLPESKQIGGIPNKLRVPRFWDPPEYGPGGIRSFWGRQGRRLLLPEEAALVGSRVKDDDDIKNGYEEQDLLQTIFVSVANYRDPECQPTVVSLLERATHPDRIRVAIVDQVDLDDEQDEQWRCHQPMLPCKEDPTQVLCRYSHLVDVYEAPAHLMVGPVFARHVAHRMYRGEYFAMQIDAHVRVVQGWDVDIIEQWEATGNEMAVLSTYMTDITDSIDPVTYQSLRHDRNVLCHVDYDGTGLQRRLTLKKPTIQKEPYPFAGSPVLHPFWSAGFSFSRGHFIVQVPYDQHLPMIFQGEESSIMIRGFTFGYDYYAPEHSVAFHIYAIRSNIARRKRHKFWENDTLFMGALEKATARMNHISGLLAKDVGNKKNVGEEIIVEDYLYIDKDKYGLGQIRSREMYFQAFGIHPEAGGSVDDVRHLCSFVQSQMHLLFTQQLRPNRMGIDYEKIVWQQSIIN